MAQDLSSSFARLENRIELMRQLAGSLTEAQAAVLALDAAALETATRHQQQLCQQLRALADIPQTACSESHETGLDQPPEIMESAPRQRWNTLLAELAAVQADVRRQNRVHAALLNRARRSTALLANILASVAGSYSASNLPQTPCPAPEQRT